MDESLLENLQQPGLQRSSWFCWCRLDLCVKGKPMKPFISLMILWRLINSPGRPLVPFSSETFFLIKFQRDLFLPLVYIWISIKLFFISSVYRFLLQSKWAGLTYKSRYGFSLDHETHVDLYTHSRKTVLNTRGHRSIHANRQKQRCLHRHHWPSPRQHRPHHFTCNSVFLLTDSSSYDNT